MSAQAAAVIQAEIYDLQSITLTGDDTKPEIVTISSKDGFFINDRFTKDFRIRKPIYDLMKKAQKNLPDGYRFMIFEAYRPLARQVHLWKTVMADLKTRYPKLSESELHRLTETFVADPYNGIGSGHQACCAIDVSLCDDNGVEYDMGTACQEFNDWTRTVLPNLPADVRKRRDILVDALEDVGFVNYPAEWWHFSYGDHQWACIMGRSEAFYGPLDI